MFFFFVKVSLVGLLYSVLVDDLISFLLSLRDVH